MGRLRAWAAFALPLWALLATACSGQRDPNDPRLHTGDRGIVMLRADWCGYCRKQEAAFKQAQIDYQPLDVDTPAGQRAMRALGVRGIPATVIGQDVVRGFDKPRLREKLQPLGYQLD